MVMMMMMKQWRKAATNRVMDRPLALDLLHDDDDDVGDDDDNNYDDDGENGDDDDETMAKGRD